MINICPARCKMLHANIWDSGERIHCKPVFVSVLGFICRIAHQASFEKEYSTGRLSNWLQGKFDLLNGGLFAGSESIGLTTDFTERSTCSTDSENNSYTGEAGEKCLYLFIFDVGTEIWPYCYSQWLLHVDVTPIKWQSGNIQPLGRE